MRPLSLRARVAAAAALGAVVVAAAVAAVVVVLLARREVAGLDRRLANDTAVLTSRIAEDTAAEGAATLPAGMQEARQLVRGRRDGLVVTIRAAAGTRSVAAGGRAAVLPAQTGDALVQGRRLRVRTADLAGGGSVTVGLPEAATDQAVARVRRATVLVALAAAAGAALLAWVLTARALRPLQLLRARTAALSGRPGAEERRAFTAGPVGHAAETAQLADALAGLLERVEQARSEGELALQAARDFAAAADHELRTPLTALRTDLDVLRAHPDLPADQRGAVLEQLAGTSERLAGTLAALGQLAAGELGDGESRVSVELGDLAGQAVAAVRRRVPDGMTVGLGLPDRDVVVLGSPAGLRLAVDNLLANAVRHSGGQRVELTVQARDGRALVLVDDDGRGVPPAQRAAVFGRFVRGEEVRTPGSGLGLALVAQQAGLHGGTATLTDSPLGGARAVLDLPLAPPARP